jgi:hypothetical protein
MDSRTSSACISCSSLGKRGSGGYSSWVARSCRTPTNIIGPGHAYVLELPKHEGPAERELNIKRTASYVIAVKNPQSADPPAAGLDPDQEARFPQKLQEAFGGRRFSLVDPSDFLDYEGAELMLIGATEDAERELGIEFKADTENEHSADAVRVLKLPREVAREPLFLGRWK